MAYTRGDIAKGEGVAALDESQWLVRHREGDPTAFAQLMARYRAPIYGYLVRCAVPSASRDDLFQEVFARVAAGAEGYRPERPLRPWLFAIAANAVRTHFRRQRVQRLVFNETEAAATGRADGQLEAKETGAWLERAIGVLPLLQRQVLVLACVEHLEMKEIARALELPVGTVKTHLHRARLALARALMARKARIAREAQQESP